MKFIKKTSLIIYFFLLISRGFVQGMDMPIRPSIGMPTRPIVPYDCIENIVCYSHIIPLARTCLAIVGEEYGSRDSGVCNALVKRYHKFESLRLVCKRADVWFTKIWYGNNAENCRRLLELKQSDADVVLQKAVVFQNPFCMTIAFKLGANVNAPIVVVGDPDSIFNRSTAIFSAVLNGDYAILQWLIEQGALTNIVIAGFLTPRRLAHAIMETYVKNVERAPYEKIIALLQKQKH